MNETRELSSEVVKSKEVIGVSVKNKAGENLGEIYEIILDKHKGYARYVVLSFGGFLGIGDKLFALPWEVISYNPEEECFILNIDKEKLKNAPGFDKNNWPNMADQTWGKNIYNYYGIRPYWE